MPTGQDGLRGRREEKEDEEEERTDRALEEDPIGKGIASIYKQKSRRVREEGGKVCGWEETAGRTACC